jgi:ABC-2 type transport system permease protein
MLAVFVREFKSYFQNITGFVFMGLFLLITGVFFTYMNLLALSPDYNGLLGNITFITLIVIPIITMRLLSDDYRQKTDQLLLTSPLSITGIVLGKYFAAVAVFLLTLILTCIYPILLSTVGFLEAAMIIGGYIGYFLLGCCFISVGLFISSLTDNQVIAAVTTFFALFFIWLLDLVQQVIPSDQITSLIFAAILVLGATLFVFFTIRNIFVSIATAVVGGGIVTFFYLLDPTNYQSFIIRFFQWFSLVTRYDDFNRGILSISPIVYYISFCAAFNFLTVRVIEKRRWK